MRPWSFRPSRACARWIALVHGAGALAIFSMPWPGGARAIVAVACLLMGWQGLRRYAWRSCPGAIVQARWTDGIGWALRRRDGAWVVAAMGASAVVHPALVSVALRTGPRPWQRRNLLVPADALETEEHRRLRVMLREYFSRQRGTDP